MIEDFYRLLASYYADHGRHDMAWRQPEPDGRFDPYKILVSELMLQQTQVSRVAPKYAEFLARFPDVTSLAAARLGEVLTVWSGLGYNRRAKFLWQAANVIEHDFGGVFPTSYENLIKLPGVGPNTAGALLAYAFDQPVAYLETNIRTVLIHHFFADEDAVPDSDLRTILDQTLELRARDGSLTPREFYWALMDYGAHLKKTVGNASRSSKTYTKQSTFAGSQRQLRGLAIRLLTQHDYTASELVKLLDDERALSVINDLVRENLVQRTAGRLHLH